MKIYVGVPMHGAPAPQFFTSMGHLLASRLPHELMFAPRLHVSNLARSRNRMVVEAMRAGADKLLFLDDDMVFDPSQVQALLEVSAPVVAGMYATKESPSRPVGYRREDVGMSPKTSGPLLGMASVGMGMTVVDLPWVRDTLLPRVGKYVEPNEIEMFPTLFAFTVTSDMKGTTRFLGEDEYFCKEVLMQGGDVWLHTGVRVGHVGSFVYTVP